jgi:hypothetical protein
MKAKLILLLVLTLLLLSIPTIFLAPGSVLAQSGGGYDLEWQTLSNGGDQFASGGDYQLGFTAGQDTPPLVSAGGSYQLVQGFWAGATGLAPAKPKAITDLTASQVSGKCQLDWSAVTEDVNGNPISGVTYNVYRAIGDPYFTPGVTYATGLTAPTYTDPDATVFGDANKNAFYLVTAVSSGGESDISNRVGTFNFSLVPGS